MNVRLPTPGMIDLCGATLCIGISAAAWFGVVEPWIARGVDARLAAARSTMLHEDAGSAATTLAEVRSQLREARSALANEALQLDPLTRLNGRLAALTASAAACGIDVSELAPGRPAIDSDGARVPIRISGRGSYVDGVSFLHRLRETMPDVAVASVHLDGNPRSANDMPRLTVSLVWHAAAGA